MLNTCAVEIKNNKLILQTNQKNEIFIWLFLECVTWGEHLDRANPPKVKTAKSRKRSSKFVGAGSSLNLPKGDQNCNAKYQLAYRRIKAQDVRKWSGLFLPKCRTDGETRDDWAHSRPGEWDDWNMGSNGIWSKWSQSKQAQKKPH